MAESKDSLPTSVVTLVEENAFRSAATRARLVFLTVTWVGAVVGAIVLTPWHGPLWGLVLGGAAGFVLGLVSGSLVAAWPVLRVLWHWSAEMATVLALVSCSTWLEAHTAAMVPALVLAGVAAVVTAVPRTRRWVRAWVWCAIVRHRLRLSFAAFLRSRNGLHVGGAQPFVLLARPTPAGERVWVWLRPGLDLEELDTLVLHCVAESASFTSRRRASARIHRTVQARVSSNA
jgi:hypothetical protein